MITLNTNRQYKINAATTATNAAPTSLYWTIYYNIKKANNIIRLIYVLSYTRTIINMSTIKDDKNKSPKGPLVITKQSPKKARYLIHNNQSYILFSGTARFSRCFRH